MGPKIVFLGVAGDHYIAGKQLRGSGGIVFKADDLQFHIDPGPGTLVRNRQYNVNARENTAILVSSYHINHCNDVNALISATTANGLDHISVLIAAKSLLQGVEGQTPFITEFHKECVERVIGVEQENKIALNNIEIEVLKTSHSDESGVGFKFITPKFTFLYSGDTEYFDGIKDIYKGADILILNVQEPFGRKVGGRLNADDAVKILKLVNPKLGIITHFGIKMLNADPIFVAREIQKQSNVKTMAAKDGMCIDPLSCSVAMSQKTLNIYES
ncbi:MBL fold metallo-hydrolase [Candidatus Woesearchaeota archaeon]|nr:MBL fold metallo-hydrolase [Candidatus Woesearchaeota archaeon]